MPALSTPAECPDFSEFSYRILNHEWASVPVAVAPVRRAVVCWSSAPGITEGQRTELAVRVDLEGVEWARADRYGGAGIGGNGGSGRAVLHQGFYVKGVGPTALIGRSTHSSHAHGEVSLREAIEETIFAEIFAYELPWSAVRTRAIIDTCENIVWPVGAYPPIERRALLVREPTLRLAHFERAAYFTGSEPLCGPRDIRRVENNGRMLRRIFGEERIEAMLRQFWIRWCEQHAYLYVTRMAAGAPSPSNIALDGRLLDFGISSALNDWCATALYHGFPETGLEFGTLLGFQREFYEEQAEGAFTRGESLRDYVAALGKECSQRYLLRIGIEMLRLAGLRRETIGLGFGRADFADGLSKAVITAMNYYRRRFRTYAQADPEDWDFPRFWDDEAPSQLRPLRTIADALARAAVGEPIRQRMRARCKLRERMLNHSFRSRLQQELPSPEGENETDRSFIREMIAREVTMARRDSKCEPPNDYLCGFAAAAGASYALFRNVHGHSYAIQEPEVGPARAGPNTESRIPLHFSNDGRINGQAIDAVHLL